MAGSFASGFATGFINERNRRLDAQKETDQITLKARMDALAKESDRYYEKSKKEEEQNAQAKNLAEFYKDPKLEVPIRKFLAGGRTADEFGKLYEDGQFEFTQPTGKTVDIPNPDVAANKAKVVVPAGVDTTVPPVDETLPMQPKLRGETEASYNTFKTGQAPDTATTTNGVYDPAKDPAMQSGDSGDIARADKTIADAGLNDIYTKAPEVKTDTQLNDESDGSWRIIPKAKETKFKSMAEEKYDYTKAVNAGDLKKAADQKYKIQLLQEDLNEQARQKAKEQGVDLQPYAIYNADGSYAYTAYAREGANGAPVNPSGDDPKPLALESGQKFQKIAPQVMEAIPKVRHEYAKDTGDYEYYSQSATQVIHYANKMTALNNQYKDSSMTANVTGAGLDALYKIDANIEALKGALDEQQLKLTAAVNSENPSLISQQMGVYESTLQALEKRAAAAAPKILSDANAKKAMDRTLYENYKTLLAYKIASVNGQSAGKMSNKDFEIAKQLIDGNADTWDAANRILRNQTQNVIANNDLRRQSLDDRVSSAINTELGGFDPGLKPKMLTQIMPREDREYFMQVSKQTADAMNYTNDSLKAADFADQVTNGVVPQQKDTSAEPPDRFNKVKGKIYTKDGKKYEYVGTPEGEELGPNSYKPVEGD